MPKNLPGFSRESVNKYQDYEQKVILFRGIADLHPYEIQLPDAPKPEQIINFGKKPEEQFFQRTKLPKDLLKIDYLVKSGPKRGGITYEEGIKAIERDKELTAFCEMLWRKRLGEELEFQYINGRPLHIPPEYWMYLNHWQMPRVPHERPAFRADFHHYCTDLWFFTLWRYSVKNNPYCNGLIDFTQRQVGKSFRGGCLGYETCSTQYEAHTGMQSKTDEDAAKIFNKCIVRPWTNLLFIFQPLCSNSSFPKGEGLQFTPAADRAIDKTSASHTEDHIMGSFTYKSSKDNAYDGDTLDFYLCDEAAKTTVGQVDERWRVVRESLKRRGGKALFTTTVEEMDKGGGANFKLIWDDSNRALKIQGPGEVRVDANGETNSGLYPTFSPSYCNEHFNAHGISIVDKITQKEKDYLKASMAWDKNIKYWWMSGMESVDHQISKAKTQQDKQSIIRKKPRNIKEAFRSATGLSFFNREIVNERCDHFLNGYTLKELAPSTGSVTDAYQENEDLSGRGIRFGRFDPIDANKPFGEMKFVQMPMQDAPCHVNYLLPKGMRNRRVPEDNGKFSPGNKALFRSGADPFKYDTPDVKNPSKMSDGAQHVYMFYDPLLDYGKDKKDWVSNNFIYEYLFRPVSVDDLCYDYAKAVIYYGCAIYPENNNKDVLKYFKDHGLEHYIQHGLRIAVDPKEGLGYKVDTLGGDTTGVYTIQKMFRHMDDFVNRDGPGCVFPRTWRDIRDVERDNLNPYDLFVSACYTLMAAYEADVIRNMEEQTVGLGMDDIEYLNGYKGDSLMNPDFMSGQYFSR